MRHRILLLILSLVLLPLLLVSCFWQGPAAPGSIAFSMSTKALGKSMDQQAETLRIYLFSGDTIFPLSSAEYAEAKIIDRSATYNSDLVIPAGSYKLMLAAGHTVAGKFQVTDYADPVSITISPGVSTTVPPVALKASPFTFKVLWGENVPGAAVVGGSGYVTAAGSLYPLTPNPLTLGTGLTIPGAPTVNSLSVGLEYGVENSISPTPWLNTSQGILPYSIQHSDFVATFTAPGNGAVDVLDSVGVNTGLQIIAIYERNAGLGGALVTTTLGATPTWNDANLEDFLTGKPFLDVIVGNTQNYVYFATALGAFRLDASVVSNGSTADEILKKCTFFKVRDTADKEIPILSLAILSGNQLLMGTANGLYTATLDEDSSLQVTSNSPTLVSGTEGNAITKIRMATVGGKSVAALLSDANVFTYDGTTVASYPFYSGLPEDLPGRLNTIMLLVDGTSLHLVAAGQNGLAVHTFTP